MEFQFKGANCVLMTTKAGSLLTDPNLGGLGGKQPSMAKIDVCLLTDPTFRPANAGDAFIIDSPGEYEVKGYAIRGIAARSHLAREDEMDLRSIYRISTGELHVAFLGHVYPELSDDQLEALGVIDILFVPIGGNGYTLDAVGATKVVKLVSPKVVIPTHYADPSLNYPVVQGELEAFVKELGAPHQEVEKLKCKRETLEENLTIYSLKRA